MDESNPQNHPWLQQKKESAADYQKFLIYCELPPSQRSFDAAYRVWRTTITEEAGKPPAPTKARAHKAWYKTANNHEWEKRANEWDAHKNNKRQLANEEKNEAARQKRRDMIDRRLDDIDAAIDRMDFQSMTPEELRRYMPDLLNAMTKLLASSRAETGDDKQSKTPGRGQTQISTTVTVTSDDIARAVHELKNAGFSIIPEPIST